MEAGSSLDLKVEDGIIFNRHPWKITRINHGEFVFQKPRQRNQLITPNRLTVVTNNSRGTRRDEKGEKKQRNFITGGLLLQDLGE